MKIVNVKDCLNCPNLKEYSIMEDYICTYKTNGVTEYVGDTKWQISGSTATRPCYLDELIEQ